MLTIIMAVKWSITYIVTRSFLYHAIFLCKAPSNPMCVDLRIQFNMTFSNQIIILINIYM